MSFGIPTRNGLGVGLLASTSLATRNRGGFSPLTLFANGEQGYWLDPSDFSTMFQDAAGTVPVTAVGQSVRRILDKSGRGNHFTQANVANAPILQVDGTGRFFLLFDGTDDWLQSAATINPGAVDKAQVFAGVRKLSDVAQVIVEASANVNTNNGAFGIFVGDSLGRLWSFSNRGTIPSPRGDGATAPDTAVITGIGDIAAPLTRIRRNGVVGTLGPAAENATLGTGNYLTYTHFIGRRGGTTLPFNGRLYQLIARYGPNLTAAQITQTENFVNQRTGAF